METMTSEMDTMTGEMTTRAGDGSAKQLESITWRSECYANGCELQTKACLSYAMKN